MFIRLECVAGDSIKDSMLEMIRISRLLDIMVVSMLNGTEAYAFPNSNLDALHKQWKYRNDNYF